MKVLEISKEDLNYNINKIKEYIIQKKQNDNENIPKIIGVIKGNGYGLGIAEMANILIENEINILAVSTLEEAIELKKAEVKADILLLGGTAEKEVLTELIESNIIITISSFEDIDTLEKIYEEKVSDENEFQIRAHIKIDTGFNRYGFKIEEIEKLCTRLKELNYLKIEGTFSHFSYAYYKNNKFVNRQFRIFKECIGILKENGINTGILHICNTSAFIKYPEMHLDAVRIGSALIGRMQVENELHLKKIGKFYATISEIKNIKKGETIGYSNSEKAKKDLKVAVLQAGYIDGLNSGKYNDTFKSIDKIRIIKHAITDLFKDKHIYYYLNHNKCRVIGMIGMNHCILDVTNIEANIGDKVLIQASPLNINTKIRREYI